jgi:formylglycine-generating enzyme required for sulfatase activity
LECCELVAPVLEKNSPLRIILTILMRPIERSFVLFSFVVALLMLGCAIESATPAKGWIPEEVSGVTTFLDKFAADSGITMVAILPGAYSMGSPDDEAGRATREGPQTHVTISRPFFLGVTDVTQAQWTAVMGSNPSYFKGDARPVEQVSWDDAMAFCEKLTEREREAGRLPAGWEFTLPTEAQWEFACRAGTAGARYGDLNDIAWFVGNSGHATHPVGTKQPNAWGLYDILGNVYQWCLDWYGSYPGGNVTNPVGSAFGRNRGNRGGCWDFTADCCRSAYRAFNGRDCRSDILGFRLALCPVR